MHAAVRRVLLAFLLGSLAVGCAATSAAAHSELIGTTPAAGSAVGDSPTELALSFSDGVLPVGVVVRATDAAGAVLTAEAPVVSGRQVVQRLAPATVSGRVSVVWRIVSVDGHQLQGTFGFAVGGGTAAAPPSAASSAPSPAAAQPAPAEAASTDDDGGPWLLAGLAVAALAALGAVAVPVVRRRRRP
jgi:methionine-rich copper-binding protein CopC